MNLNKNKSTWLIKSIAVAVLLLFQGLSMAQKITGYVRDSLSHPIASALVCKTNYTQCTETDSKGQFTIDAFAGDTLIVNLMGFRSQYTIVKSKKTVVTLSYQTNQLETVYLKSGPEKKVQENPGYNISSIDLKPVQDQAIDLTKVLDQASGVRVRQEGGLGSRATYSLNGLSGRSVKFYLDGVPMDYFGASFSPVSIPVSMLDRIDIYKGVVPIDLGSDALGGAINLVTTKKIRNVADLSYIYGSFNTHKAFVSANFRDSATGITSKNTLFYNHSDNNYWVWGDDVYITNPQTFEVENNKKVRRFHDAFTSKGMKLDLGITQKKWADQLFAGLIASNMNKQIQHGSTMEVVYGQANYRQALLMPNITYQKANFILQNLDITAFAGYSHLVRQHVDTSTNIYNWYGEIENYSRTLGGENNLSLNKIQINNAVSRINLVYKPGKTSRFGFNYILSNLVRNDNDPTITNKNEGYWAPQRYVKNTAGVSYQRSFGKERLQSTIFTKYAHLKTAIQTFEIIDNNNFYSTIHSKGQNAGYGLALLYKLKPTWSILGSVEHSFQQPEAEDLLGDGIMTLANPNLKAENSLNANLGSTISLQHKHHKLDLGAFLFARYVRDYIQKRQFDLGAFRFENVDNVNIYGFDIDFKYSHNEKWILNQAVSKIYPLDKTEKDQFGNQNILKDSRLPNMPYFQTSTELGYKPQKLLRSYGRFTIYYRFNFVNKFHKNPEILGSNNLSVIPAQFVSDIGCTFFSYQTRISTSLEGQNIFNAQAYDNYAVQKPGRAFYIKISYRII